MLSNLSRLLTYLCAVLYAILGMLLYILPEQLSPVFAWKVTAFMTMTIGGWCLGNAWLAWVAARRWEWRLVSSSLLYLWMFGVFEIVILLIFRDKLVLNHPIAWMYVVTLLVNVVTALVGMSDWLNARPAIGGGGPLLAKWIRILPPGAVFFTGSLGLSMLVLRVGYLGTNNRELFPEILSPFTMRSFGAFFFALGLAVIPLLDRQRSDLLLSHLYGTMGFFISITIAAFAYLHLFDFIGRPLGLAYVGIYVVVGIAVIIVLLKYGTGLRKG